MRTASGDLAHHRGARQRLQRIRNILGCPKGLLAVQEVHRFAATKSLPWQTRRGPGLLDHSALAGHDVVQAHARVEPIAGQLRHHRRVAGSPGRRVAGSPPPLSRRSMISASVLATKSIAELVVSAPDTGRRRSGTSRNRCCRAGAGPCRMQSCLGHRRVRGPHDKSPAPGGAWSQRETIALAGDQSPCCFCRCSQRSWASMVRSAVRRASRRSRPISSPVSTQ